MTKFSAVSLLCIVVFCGTSTATAITIISGTDGNGNALPHMGLDPLTNYISASSSTESAAIAWINRSNPANEPLDLIGSEASQTISTASVSDTWAEFYYEFSLPSEMTAPVLSLQLAVDDEAKVYLNGNQLGGIYTHVFDPATHTIIEDNASLFNIGGNNVLKFHVINANTLQPWKDIGYGRAGSHDWMAIEFEGTVYAAQGGLVAHYKLDGIAGPVLDDHGSNDGTNVGAARGESGLVGNAFGFETPGYVNLPTGLLTLSDHSSVSLWIRVTESLPHSIIIDLRGDIDAVALIRNGRLEITGGNGFGQVPLNSWHHIAMTDDGSITRVYQDGVSMGGAGVTHFNPGHPQNRIGAGSDTPDNYFEGKIDDVMIWDHALTAADIAALYQVPGVIPPSDDPLPEPVCDDPLPLAPAPEGLVFITHGWKPPGYKPWVDNMKAAVEATIASDGVPGDWDVYGCKWDGGWSASPESALIQGSFLGWEIGKQIKDAGYSKVHFIGHSAGSWLTQNAINRMRSEGSSATIHATFLDAFTPWNLGTGPNGLGFQTDYAEHFVDTIPTGLGFGLLPYGGIDPTNGRLDAAHNITITDVVGPPGSFGGHPWPHEWYENTIITPDGPDAVNGWGFNKSQEIGDPINHSDSGNPPTYPKGETTSIGLLISLEQWVAQALIVAEAIDWAAQEISGALITAGDIVVDAALNSLTFSIPIIASRSAVAGTEPPGPSWATSLIESDTPFSVVTFDYEFLSGSGGVLSAHFEGEVIFTAYQDLLPPGPHSATITLTNLYPAGSYSLAFRLDSDGASATDVTVSGVQFEVAPVVVVPALPTILAMVLAMALLGTGLTFAARRSRA